MLIVDKLLLTFCIVAPKIGHALCGVMTCAGNTSNVPKHMGWLWTAQNVPGLKVSKCLLKFVILGTRANGWVGITLLIITL